MSDLGLRLEPFWIGAAVHLWQSAIFCGVLALVGLALRHSSARLLCTLYWIGVLKLLLPLPLLGPLFRRIDLLGGGALGSGPAEAGWSGVTVLMYPVLFDGASHSLAEPPAWVYVVLTAVVLSGAGAASARTLARSIHAGRALRRRDDCPAPLEAKLDAAAADAGVARRLVRVVSSRGVPFVWGTLRPAIVVPRNIVAELAPGELRAILAHEAEHLRRRDPLRYAVLAAVRALFWFYPPAWWLVRRIRETTELACDEAVVRGGTSPAAYGRSLARALGAGLADPAIASSLGVLGHGASTLRRRLERLRSGRRFEAMFAHRVVLLLAVVVALAVSVVPQPPVAAGAARPVGEGLNELQDADLEVMFNFKQVPASKVLEKLNKTTGVEFHWAEDPPDRLIDIDLPRTPLAEALKQLGLVAGLRYRVMDSHSVEVRPIVLVGTDGVTMPKLIASAKVKPVYPKRARDERTEGRVILQAVIEASGRVGDIEVLKTEPPGYEEFAVSAVEAVGQWRYEPARRDGVPVDVVFTIRINFSLNPDKPAPPVEL